MSTRQLEHSRSSDLSRRTVEKAKDDLRAGIKRLEALIDDAYATLDPEEKSWTRRARSREAAGRTKPAQAEPKPSPRRRPDKQRA